MKPKLLERLVLFCLIIAPAVYGEDGARVEFFSPQGTVKDVRQVSARFSEQMVPFGDPRALIEPFDVDFPMPTRKR